jgi:hypothetical protein
MKRSGSIRWTEQNPERSPITGQASSRFASPQGTARLGPGKHVSGPGSFSNVVTRKNIIRGSKNPSNNNSQISFLNSSRVSCAYLALIHHSTGTAALLGNNEERFP